MLCTADSGTASLEVPASTGTITRRASLARCGTLAPPRSRGCSPRPAGTESSPLPCPHPIGTTHGAEERLTQAFRGSASTSRRGPHRRHERPGRRGRPGVRRPASWKQCGPLQCHAVSSWSAGWCRRPLSVRTRPGRRRRWRCWARRGPPGDAPGICRNLALRLSGHYRSLPVLVFDSPEVRPIGAQWELVATTLELAARSDVALTGASEPSGRRRAPAPAPLDDTRHASAAA